MKVIIPVINDSDKKNIVASGFHKTDYMCICDTSENSYEWCKTSQICEFVSDFANELYLRDIEAVISIAMPFMALGLFLERGFDVYQAKGTSLEGNIELLTQDKLFMFSPTAVRQLSACGGACVSCDSDCSKEDIA